MLECAQQRAARIDRFVETVLPRARGGRQGRDASPQLRATGRRGDPPGLPSPTAAPGRAARGRRRPRRARSTSSTPTPASSPRSRRARRRASLSSRSCSAPLASRNARCLRSGRLGRRPSRAPPRAARRGRARRVRPIASHACVDRVRCRCTRRLSRSSSSHPRSLGHSRMSASWANCTVPSSTVTSRPWTSLSRSPSTADAGPARGQLPERHAPPGVLGPLSGLRQPEERASKKALLGLVGAFEELLRGSRDGAAHAAGIPISGQRHRPPVAAEPTSP